MLSKNRNNLLVLNQYLLPPKICIFIKVFKIKAIFKLFLKIINVTKIHQIAEIVMYGITKDGVQSLSAVS